MDKLFVSVPMKGISNEDIQMMIKKMTAIAKIAFGKSKFEVVSGFEPSADATDIAGNLGRSVAKMSGCEYFIGVHMGYLSGCDIESNVASKMKMKKVLLYTRDWAFFEEPMMAYHNAVLEERKANSDTRPDFMDTPEDDDCGY